MEFLKQQIEKTAKELGVSEIVVIQKMQGALVEKGDEKSILELHTLKMHYAKKLNIF